MPRASKTKGPAHRPSRREDVLDAAARVFVRDGVSRATIPAIAAESTMSATSVYYHFHSRAEIVMAIVAASSEDLVEGVRATMDVGEADRQVLIGRLVEAAFTWLADDELRADVFLSWSVGFSTEVEEFRNRTFRALEALLSEALTDVAGGAVLGAGPEAKALSVRAAVGTLFRVLAATSGGQYFPAHAEVVDIRNAVVTTLSELLR